METWECNGCEKHHMIQSEECPGYCFMTGRAIRNDCREVNGGKSPKLADEELKWPSWCKVGAWVWVSKDANVARDEYHRIEKIEEGGMIHFSGGLGTGICNAGKMFYEARIHPWTDDELKQKVGKAFEDVNGELHLCLGYTVVDVVFPKKGKAGAVYMAGRGHFAHTAEYLLTIGWNLDGSPCGVLEHFDANREECVK